MKFQNQKTDKETQNNSLIIFIITIINKLLNKKNNSKL